MLYELELISQPYTTRKPMRITWNSETGEITSLDPEDAAFMHDHREAHKRQGYAHVRPTRTLPLTDPFHNERDFALILFSMDYQIPQALQPYMPEILQKGDDEDLSISA